MLVRVWQCADGRNIRIDQMSTSHIYNCIALILSKKNWRRSWLDAFALELRIRDLTEKGVQ